MSGAADVRYHIGIRSDAVAGGWRLGVDVPRCGAMDVLDRAFAAIGGYEHTRTRKSNDRAEIMFSKIERLAIRIPSDYESPGVGINTESPSRD